MKVKNIREMNMVILSNQMVVMQARKMKIRIQRMKRLQEVKSIFLNWKQALWVVILKRRQWICI